MNTVFRPAPSARILDDTRPRAAFELAWLTQSGTPDWQTRVLPLSPNVEAAVSSIARGGLLATPDGQIAIEDLQPGQVVSTATGGQAQVQWVGSRTQPEGALDVERPPLYRVSVGAFGHNAPAQDVVLANGASVLVRSPACRKLIGQDIAFAPISAFEDSYNVTRIVPVGDITVYNLACDGQEAIIVNGLPIESFHPGRGTMQVLNDDVLRDMARLFPHLHAGKTFGPQSILHLSMTEARSLEIF